MHIYEDETLSLSFLTKMKPCILRHHISLFFVFVVALTLLQPRNGVHYGISDHIWSCRTQRVKCTEEDECVFRKEGGKKVKEKEEEEKNNDLQARCYFIL